MWSDVTDRSSIGFPSDFCFVFVKKKKIVLVPAYFPIPDTCGQVCCTFSWYIPVNPCLLGICIQKHSLCFQSGFGLTLVPLWLLLIWVYARKKTEPMFSLIFSVISNGKKLGAFLKVVTWSTLLVLDLVF